MKVVIQTLTKEAIEDRDYRDAIEILIDSKKVFSVGDGEKEDNNLSRNFNDCYFIDNIIKQAYKAGKNGEDLEIEEIKLDEF